MDNEIAVQGQLGIESSEPSIPPGSDQAPTPKIQYSVSQQAFLPKTNELNQIFFSLVGLFCIVTLLVIGLRKKYNFKTRS